MKLGIMLDTNVGPVGREYPTQLEVRRFYEMLGELARLTEDLGFDGLFVPERHIRTDCFAPSPLGLLAHYAASTTKIDLGTYVLMLAMYPIRSVLEQVNQLDQLSRGRIIFGVGSGYHRGYFAAFEVPAQGRTGRFASALEDMRQAWHTGWIGESPIVPPPYQVGGPPVWIGATKPPGIERAAEHGDAWCVGFADVNFPSYVQLYRDACSRHGRHPSLVMLQEGWVRSEPHHAERDLAALSDTIQAEISFYAEQDQLSLPDPEAGRMERLRRHMAVGTPDDAAEHVLEVVDRYGPSYYVFRVHVGLFSETENRDCLEGLARVARRIRASVPPVGRPEPGDRPGSHETERQGAR